MENIFIILGLIFFVAWITGLLISSVPSVWKFLIGDSSLKWKAKKHFYTTADHKKHIQI